MIQRIQSLFLLGVFVLALITVLVNPTYAVFKDDTVDKKVELGYTKTTTSALSKPDDLGVSTGKWINTLIIMSIGLGSLVALFMYKKTALQKKLSIYCALLGAVLIAILVADYYSMSNQLSGASTYPGLSAIFPGVFVVLNFLAWYKIHQDELLLKSMDRIR